MGITQNTKIVTDGLVFCYDADNIAKSWKGKPTTNYAYTQNARTDASYASYVQTTSGTWPAKHPDAIRVYNFQGSEITGYVNTGVGDYTNTYHAIWTLDPILKKPVVTMRDVDGNWKAKSWGLGVSMTGMGLGYGSTYTISWLQWTDNIAKSAQAGLYGQNTSGANGFHDGQSLSKGPTAFNTKPYTWQRVYASFTVSNARNLAANVNCYMYGHYVTRGTIKIADVQIEPGTVSGFLEDGVSSRSSTETIVDLTGNNIVTPTSLTYNNDGSFSFNGSNNYLTISTFVNKPTTAITCEAWIYPTKPTLSGTIRGAAISATNSMYLGIINSVDGGLTHALHWANQTSVNRVTSWNGNVPNNAWSHIAGTYDGTTMRAYLNGVQIYSAAQTGTIPDATYVLGTYGGALQDGVHNFNGLLPSSKIYNRALTADEIMHNFNALRGRYGI